MSGQIEYEFCGKVQYRFVGREKLSNIFVGKFNPAVGKFITILIVWQIKYRFCRQNEYCFYGKIEVSLASFQNRVRFCYF